MELPPEESTCWLMVGGYTGQLRGKKRICPKSLFALPLTLTVIVLHSVFVFAVYTEGEGLSLSVARGEEKTLFLKRENIRDVKTT